MGNVGEGWGTGVVGRGMRMSLVEGVAGDVSVEVDWFPSCCKRAQTCSGVWNGWKRKMRLNARNKQGSHLL